MNYALRSLPFINLSAVMSIKIVILQKPMFRCILIFVVLSYMEEIWLRTILSYS